MGSSVQNIFEIFSTMLLYRREPKVRHPLIFLKILAIAFKKNLSNKILCPNNRIIVY